MKRPLRTSDSLAGLGLHVSGRLYKLPMTERIVWRGFKANESTNMTMVFLSYSYQRNPRLDVSIHFH